MRARGIAVALAVAARLAGVAAASPVPEAIARYERGEYEQVVELLRGSDQIADPVDRAQALRLRGVACVLTGRTAEARDAFRHWLDLEPRAQLDPNLFPPDVVSWFERVRLEQRAGEIARVDARRPRTAALNLLPPAGQFQNGERRTFAVLLVAEVALAAVVAGTFAAFKATQRADGTFQDEGRAAALQVTNEVAVPLLAATLLYGMIDGFVVYRRLQRALEHEATATRASISLYRF